MPFQKGQPRPANAGRKPNTPNAETKTVRALLDSLGHNPHLGMAKIAMNDVPCTVCRGTLRTKYSLPEERPCRKCLTIDQRNAIKSGEPHEGADSDCQWCAGTGWQTVSERPCASCNTSGMEPIEPRLMGQMNAELAKYVSPQLKAIEHTGDPDNPMHVVQGYRLEVVDLSKLK